MKNKYAPGENPFIVIPAVLASIFLVIVIMFLIFSKDNLTPLESIAWAFAAMGIFAILFAYYAEKKRR